MAHWKTEQYAERLTKNQEIRKIHCLFEECPRFSRCEMVPSQGMFFASKRAKVFFATDTTSEDEADLRMPAVQPAGRLLREAMISHVLTQKKIPYLITKLFRAYIGDKQPKIFESKLCFSHFLKELKEHEPQLVVALGIGVFNTLYAQAINKADLPSKEDHKINTLRGRFFEFHFEDDIKVKVLITHSPGSVMITPALYKLFKEDAQTISEFFLTGSEVSKKANFKVERIDKLETVKDVFEYLDFLRYGLKEPSVIAFDTETRNLNRKYNNAFLTWQFSHAEGVGVAFPIHHRDKPLFADPKLLAQLVQKMQGLLNATSKETNINWFVGHNIKFDLSVLWGLHKIIPRDPRVNIPWWCTMLAAHWLDENRKGLKGFLSGSPFSLKTFGVEFFNFYFEEEALDRRGDGALEELTLDQLYTYGGTDSVLTRAIAFHQIKVLAPQEPNKGDLALKKFVKHYYFPTSVSLAVLECNGIYVKSDHLSYLQSEDSPVWNRMGEIEHKLQNLPEVLNFRNLYKDKIGGKIKNASLFEGNLWDMPGDELPLLDLNKQDVQRLFYLDYLRLSPLKFSKKTGEPTLNARFLEHYSKPAVYRDGFKIKESFSDYYSVELGRDEKDGTPIYNENPLLLEGEYRKLKKLGTTYLDGLEGFLRDPHGDCTDSRVRASYSAHGTDTGRLCVAKGTKVDAIRDFSLYPKGINIEDIKPGDLVYCYDDKCNLAVRPVKWIGKTGTKKVVRIHWTIKRGGRYGYVDVTPDHRVRLLDGSYVEAATLKPKDRLLALARYVGTCGHVWLMGKKFKTFEHRFLTEKVMDVPLKRGLEIHHIDHNKLNNLPQNLEVIDSVTHRQEHITYHSPESMERMVQNREKYCSKFSLLKEIAKNGCKLTKCKNLYSDFNSFKRKCVERGIDIDAVKMRYNVGGKYISRGDVLRACKLHSTKCALSLGLNHYRYRDLCAYYGIEPFQGPKDFSTRFQPGERNHSVVEVEWLDEEVDVYDLEVKDFHNFIGNEITLHNSSQKPNLQQLPGRGKVAKVVKNMFQAEPPSAAFPNGTILIQGDYKTAEVRWAALFSKDSNLIEIFQESSRLVEQALNDDSISDEDFKTANLMADLHRRTASLMFGMPASEVTESQRQNAKTITFALLFGMAVNTLAENNGWTLEEAEDKLRRYFSAFPELERWLKRIPEIAKQKGYVETFMGRRRRLKHFLEMGKLAESWKHLSEGERKAMNTSIQGQSSDAGGIGMFTFMQYVFDHNLEERWLVENVVHDSCLVQAPWEDAKEVLRVMTQCFVKDMSKYIETHWNCSLPVEIQMEFEIGLKYGALEKWDGRRKSLDDLLAKLENEKENTWKKSEAPKKPPKALDFVTFHGE